MVTILESIRFHATNQQPEQMPQDPKVRREEVLRPEYLVDFPSSTMVNVR